MKKPAAKSKTPAAKAAPRKSATKASATARKGSRSNGGVSPEDRARMIAEAAYYRAEQRGFGAGDPVLDWLHAEAEIDASISRH